MGVGLLVEAVFGDGSPTSRLAYVLAAACLLGVSFGLYRSQGRRSERIWLTVAVAMVGIAEIAFAVQIRTWHGRGSWAAGDAPSSKVLVATWQASEMWVDPRLLLIGVSTLVLAVVVFFIYPRLAHRPSSPL
jgi:disulfide bond formation protein DsbB